MPSQVLTQLGPEEQKPFLTLLQEMLAIPTLEPRTALNRAGELIGQAFTADKVDVLLYEESSHTLVAVGTNDTPMSQHQRELGLNRLPLANGGREAEVFQTGTPFINGHVEHDEGMVRGLRDALGVRSTAIVPLDVHGERRGCLTLSSATPEQFHPRQLPIIAAVAHWVGLVLHQAELVERVTIAAADQARRATAEELITIMAHDIKNYLQPLFGGVELLHRRAQREGRDADLKTAQRVLDALGRLRRMIDDLMDVSRLDAGLFDVRPEPINLTDLVVRTAQDLSTPLCPIEVRAAQEIELEADASRIRQVLENLLANAQRYTPDGVPVLLELSSVAKAGRWWAVVHVRDEGPGIAPDVLPTLFARYGAGKGSVGLGLGLYLARAIAMAHGGALHAQSAPNQGSSFYLELPWNQDEAGLEDEQHSQ